MNLAHDCLEKAATRIAQRPAVIDCETGETWTLSVIKTFGTVEPIFYRRIWLILV